MSALITEGLTSSSHTWSGVAAQTQNQRLGEERRFSLAPWNVHWKLHELNETLCVAKTQISYKNGQINVLYGCTWASLG